MFYVNKKTGEAVEAMQAIDNTAKLAIVDWLSKDIVFKNNITELNIDCNGIYIKSGDIIASVNTGDYIIRRSQFGHIMSCSEESFKKNYRPDLFPESINKKEDNKSIDISKIYTYAVNIQPDNPSNGKGIYCSGLVYAENSDEVFDALCTYFKISPSSQSSFIPKIHKIIQYTADFVTAKQKAIVVLSECHVMETPVQNIPEPEVVAIKEKDLIITFKAGRTQTIYNIGEIIFQDTGYICVPTLVEPSSTHYIQSSEVLQLIISDVRSSLAVEPAK